MAANREATGLVTLRLFLGVFFLFEGLGKLRWLLNSEQLAKTLSDWASNANSWNAWYLHHVALPYVAIFARLVVLGELCCGLALIVGLFTRWAALLAFLMVLNFHFASGALFGVNFLTNGYGLPVLGALLALAIGAGRLPYSVRG
jgi:thiosulfate dehydrogenase [quinone] large subunit